MSPNDLTVIFGHGAVGRELTRRLTDAGRPVRVIQRHRPDDLAAGAEFVSADILDRDATLSAANGAARIAVTIGFAYNTKVWEAVWPKAMANILDLGQATGARIVFFDNLYMYGPQNGPISEETPFNAKGGKPAVRAAITRMWQEASRAGRVRFTALRAPDFYGPGVTNGHLGPMVFERLANGKPAMLAVPAHIPHDMAYVPDCARAMETLLDAPDDAYGDAWHVPLAPTRTLADLIATGADSIGKKPRISALPLWSLPIIGLFQPMLREIYAIRFMYDRPYHIDAQKFSRRFWGDATPFEIGMPLTARSFTGQ